MMNDSGEVNRNAELGQSTVEFIISLIFVLGLLLLFIQMAINYTSGYMAHYATFMTARTYMVQDGNSTDQDIVFNYAENMARSVFENYRNDLKPFAFVRGDYVLGFNKNMNLDGRAAKVYVGAYLRYKQKMSLFSKVGGNKKINMLSEAFLGKEPARIVCQKRICEIMRKKVTEYKACSDPTTSQATIYDNGC